MATKKKRIDRMRADFEQLQAEYDAFWDALPTAELERIAAGDPVALEKFTNSLPEKFDVILEAKAKQTYTPDEIEYLQKFGFEFDAEGRLLESTGE